MSGEGEDFVGIGGAGLEEFLDGDACGQDGQPGGVGGALSGGQGQSQGRKGRVAGADGVELLVGQRDGRDMRTGHAIEDEDTARTEGNEDGPGGSFEEAAGVGLDGRKGQGVVFGYLDTVEAGGLTKVALAEDGREAVAVVAGVEEDLAAGMFGKKGIESGDKAIVVEEPRESAG